jgi:predicted RNA-binding protein with PIN domain
MNTDKHGKILIIDGYNIIGRISSLRKKLDVSLQHAREKLVDKIKRWSEENRTYKEIIIVFDNRRETFMSSQYEVRGRVRVIFSSGEEADELIIKAIKKLDSPQNVTVCSDDNKVSNNSRVLGSKVISSRQLLQFFKKKRNAPAGKVESGDKGIEKDFKGKIEKELREAWEVE